MFENYNKTCQRKNALVDFSWQVNDRIVKLRSSDRCAEHSWILEFCEQLILLRVIRPVRGSHCLQYRDEVDVWKVL